MYTTITGRLLLECLIHASITGMTMKWATGKKPGAQPTGPEARHTGQSCKLLTHDENP